MSQVIDYSAKLNAKKFDLSRVKVPFKGLPQEKLKNTIAFFKKPAILVTIATLVILGTGFTLIQNRLNSANPKVFGSQTNFSPDKSQTVNRKFEIPIRSASGTVTGSKLPVTITTVDRAKRILIQGQPATARDGKVFLILNLDIDNSTTNQLSIRPVDFIRFQDDQGKSFAPDVHNDTVTAEPISIKKTRVGFVVDENLKSFKFAIGEISGNKETVDVSI